MARRWQHRSFYPLRFEYSLQELMRHTGCGVVATRMGLTHLERVRVFCDLAFFPVVVEGVQEYQVQIVVHGLCVLEPVGPEIAKNTVKTPRILNDLHTNKQAEMRGGEDKSLFGPKPRL